MPPHPARLCGCSALAVCASLTCAPLFPPPLQGTIRRGPAVSGGSTMPASIPSKFETTLHTAPRERDGFASRVVRFSDRVNDAPGPGDYYREHSFTFTSDSYSSKGYGSGFVSKDRRLGKNVRGQRTPGPGSYDALQGTIGGRTVSAGAQQRSSVFAQPLAGTVGPPHANRVAAKGEPTPGPGLYHSEQGMRRPCPSTGAFRSTSRRLGEDLRQKSARSNPGPDAYNLVRAMDADEGVYWHRPKTESANFRSTSGRSWETKEVRRAAAMPAVLDDTAGGAGSGGGGGGGDSANLRAPGPGSYEVDGDNIASASATAAGKASSMFSKTNTTRFGAAVDSRAASEVMPGPGAYTSEANTVKSRVGSKQTVGGSQFMSVSQRIGETTGEGLNPPGPSYYRPKTIVKKSFNLNKFDHWL